MKIAIFCDLLPTLLNLRGHLVGAMSSIADSVTVVAPPSQSELVEQLKEKYGADFFPIEMDRTGINPVRDLSYKNAISRFLGEFKPDQTFAYQAKAAVYSSIAARSYPAIRTNVLFPGLGYLFADNDKLKDRCIRWLGKQLYRYAFRDVDHFFFQNPDDLATLRDNRVIAVDAKTTIVNGSGVPLDKFEVSKPVLKPVRLLFMGRLLWEKGVREFCEAAKSLAEEWGSEVEFQILGPLDSNPSAISKAELSTLCQECNVDYLGVTDDVRPYLRNASVFVLPSYYMEGTPRSILEAMSMGRPIVTTDSRGCREPITDGTNGFLVRPKDSKDLAFAIRKFLNDRSLISTMGAAGREIAEEKYDVNKVNKTILQSMGLPLQ